MERRHPYWQRRLEDGAPRDRQQKSRAPGAAACVCVDLYNVDMGMNTPLDFDELLTQLRVMMPVLREKYHVGTLAVFGSYVRGEANSQSDLDILVTFDQVPTLFQYIALENLLSDKLGVKVDLVMKDSLKPEIGKTILAEAQLVE